MNHKRIWLILLVAVCAVVALASSPARAEANADGKADWTVLFYICGADLESRYSLATEDLAAIRECVYYRDSWNSVRNIFRSLSGEEEKPVLREPGRVKVAVQTGGAKKWHTEKLGIQVAADCLQRWECAFDLTNPELYPVPEIRLMEELPLASMSSPETLTDFIRWGTETYPAEKYCLVIWGHGGGGKTGVLIDELYDGDRMNLDELKSALAEGGIVFETVLFDACLMANLETACAIQQNARWMVASEEVVTGDGTALYNWLQQLYYCPDCDGKQLGRWICDMTQIQYANQSDKQAQDLLTWSVTDLSKIPRLARCFDRFMEAVGNIYAHDTWAVSLVMSLLESAEKYGDAIEGMTDLGGILFDKRITDCMEPDLFREMVDALNDAVVYSVRGNGRSAARGLSFCLAMDFTDAELDQYAANCPFLHYLAFLDALSPTWSAPEAIYAQVERLPAVGDLEEYTISAEKAWSESGIPGVRVPSLTTSLRDVLYRLYRKSETTDQVIYLGSNITKLENDHQGGWVYSANEPWMWPYVEDDVCSIEMLRNDYIGTLYSVPLQIGSEVWNLRCGLNDDKEPEIYGMWEGYDADSSVMNRNVMKMSNFAGQRYRLLYPTEGNEFNDNRNFEGGEWRNIYLSLRMDIRPLPSGTYYIDYLAMDRFTRPIPLDRITFIWDGTKITFPEDNLWEGALTLKWQGWPEDIN